MRCSSCGLPLSPSRAQTNCPRCRTPIDPDPKAIQQPYQQPYWGHAGTAQAGTPTQTDQWAEQPPYHPPVAQIPEYQRGVLQRYPPQSPQQAGYMRLQGPAPQQGFSQPTLLPSPPQARAPRNFRNSRLWFTVAGLCILAGALILVFVYVSAIVSPGGNTTTTGAGSPVSLPTKTPTPTATTAPTPTATIYPGQQYINNAQMASAINSSSLQPTQLTTTFKTNQKIYVTFQLHPAGHTGAVCLLWYLNGQQITQYSFAISANSKLSYAYATYGGTGAAYVELYWASTMQCTDQLLAQHVDFTVTT